MFRILIFVISFYLLFIFHEIQAKEKLICRVYDVDVCKHTSNCIFRIDGLKIINPNHENTLISGDAEFHDDVKSNVKLQVKLLRCLTRDSLDSCETFSDLSPIDTCKLLYAKNMMWSDILQRVSPPVTTCKPKKGHYAVRNASIDPNLFKIFPITGYFWRVRLTFSQDHKPEEHVTFCVLARILSVQI